MSKIHNILVVGSINMDLLLLTSRLPRAGESMFSENYFFNPGGKGANQAVAASLLGCNTTFVGKVGDDNFADILQQSLNEYGVCTEFLKISPSQKTGFAVVMLEEGGQNRIIVHQAANKDLNKTDVDEAFNCDYDAVILQFEVPEEIVIYACKLAKEKRIPIVVDAGPPQDFPLEAISGADILSPNETEAAFMCGFDLNTENDYKKAAQILKERSRAKYIVLKLGEKGACLYTDGEIKLFPAHIVEAVDTTAAGDVFTAAMAVQYLKSGDIEEAIRYASIAGALTVTKTGAQQSIPRKDEVDNFMKL